MPSCTCPRSIVVAASVVSVLSAGCAEQAFAGYPAFVDPQQMHCSIVTRKIDNAFKSIGVRDQAPPAGMLSFRSLPLQPMEMLGIGTFYQHHIRPSPESRLQPFRGTLAELTCVGGRPVTLRFEPALDVTNGVIPTRVGRLEMFVDISDGIFYGYAIRADSATISAFRRGASQR